MRRPASVLLALAAIVGFATASAEDAPLTPAQEKGKQVFQHWCVHCHSVMGWGTNRLAKRFEGDEAFLEKRTNLPDGVIRTAVRVGIGSMPPLRRTEVSDADLEALVAYLTRNNPKQ